MATYAVPWLLVAVATTQVVVASSTPLSPWKGGGFGMFTTVDQPTTRVVRAELRTSETVVGLDVASWSSDLTGTARRTYVDARSLPVERRMDRLAGHVCAREWTTTGTATDAAPDTDAPPARDCSAGIRIGERTHVGVLHLEVIGLGYERGEAVVHPVTLARTAHAVGGPS